MAGKDWYYQSNMRKGDWCCQSNMAEKRLVLSVQYGRKRLVLSVQYDRKETGIDIVLIITIFLYCSSAVIHIIIKFNML